jgi:hypothetical protein
LATRTTEESYLRTNLSLLVLAVFLLSTVLTQSLTFFPDLSNQGGSGINYRTNFSFGTVTRINRWLGWENNMSDTYVTNPPVGKKQNEFVFTSGLNLAFLH